MFLSALMDPFLLLLCFVFKDKETFSSVEISEEISGFGNVRENNS